MNIDRIFDYYDQLIAPLPPYWQAIISFGLLILLILQIYSILKHGHWIFILLLIIFLPGTWPATKQVGEILLVVANFLFSRARVIF